MHLEMLEPDSETRLKTELNNKEVEISFRYFSPSKNLFVKMRTSVSPQVSEEQSKSPKKAISIIKSPNKILESSDESYELNPFASPRFYTSDKKEIKFSTLENFEQFHSKLLQKALNNEPKSKKNKMKILKKVLEINVNRTQSFYFPGENSKECSGHEKINIGSEFKNLRISLKSKNKIPALKNEKSNEKNYSINQKIERSKLKSEGEDIESPIASERDEPIMEKKSYLKINLFNEIPPIRERNSRFTTPPNKTLIKKSEPSTNVQKNSRYSYISILSPLGHENLKSIEIIGDESKNKSKFMENCEQSEENSHRKLNTIESVGVRSGEMKKERKMIQLYTPTKERNSMFPNSKPKEKKSPIHKLTPKIKI